jgi:hypothetical protein
MNDQEISELKNELFNLVAYMVTSSRGLYDEPADYGIFRILDSAGRLLAVMESRGLMDPFLEELKTIIDAEREGNMDYDGQRERLDAAVVKISLELTNRL